MEAKDFVISLPLGNAHSEHQALSLADPGNRIIQEIGGVVSRSAPDAKLFIAALEIGVGQLQAVADFAPIALTEEKDGRGENLPAFGDEDREHILAFALVNAEFDPIEKPQESMIVMTRIPCL